jgi:predicted ATPase/class 3 adenylate cyclase/DNA-binding CsgD family transcriptional regulator
VVARSTPRVEGAQVVGLTGDTGVITVGTSAWYAWLEAATTFAFHSTHGSFTARKEQHGSTGWYWKAYRKRGGRLQRAYLGKSADLTLERLNGIASTLTRSTVTATQAPNATEISAPLPVVATPVAALPTGTVTFLLTDIEGSTSRWEQHPDAMGAALAHHDRLLRETIAAHAGVVVKTAGDGIHAVFARAADALMAALSAQRLLQAADWGTLDSLRVRMALHTGTAEVRDGDYFGAPLNQVARILAAGHGSQILLSRATAELVRETLPPDVLLHDLGVQRLKDLVHAEHIFQLVTPDLRADFPPLKTLDLHLGGLPAQPTPFIGRDKERMLVRMLLRRADVRLLTLSGPGGTGKTRLALQVAAELRDDFPDGVAFVALASISDPTLVLPTIAKVLGVIDAGYQRLIARLSDALHDKHLLLLLDNFEQVLPSAPDVAMLLAASPSLKLLVTSRAALHLSWEREFTVPPLTVPTHGTLPSRDQVQQYDAVQFFVARAQTVQADFTLTDENAVPVAEICRRLDGLPLAIELATARLKLFTPQALLARLDRRLPLLTGGPRDLPARQQTLRATIDWSYNLLEPWEQTLFAQLGVFVGGCTLEAVEAVCELDIINKKLKNDDNQEQPSLFNSQFSILNLLESLANKSLLQQTQGRAGEPRFVILETIHEYASEQLMARGELASIRRKHAEFFLALAEAAATALEGDEQGAWLSQLQQEHENLRAVLRCAVEQQEAELGMRLAVALRLFWFTRGHLSEGRERLATVLALENGSASTRAKALDCAGFLARYQGDYAAAADLISESLALWRSLGQSQGIADALSNLGYVTLHQGDYAAARALYEESLGLYSALGNAQGRADCLSHLGAAAFYQGDYAAAQALHEETLAIWRALGDIEGVAYALYNLGDALLAQADDRAALRFTESLTAAMELEWPWGIVSAVEGAAGLAAFHARPQVALRLASFAARLRTTVAIPLAPARATVLAHRLAPAQQALSELACTAAWAEGALLTLEQAVAASFAELATSPTHASGPARLPEPTRKDVGGLTTREREVAILIAEGKSNRAIAATLVVGVKTVEAHTSRILTKLGFSSRTQIAAWAVAKGLAHAPDDFDAQAHAPGER